MDFAGKVQELEAYFTGIWLTDCANFAAFTFHEMPDLNWAGFYFSDGEKLRLGPFSGRPACTEIRFDRGVCGAAYTNRKPLLVADVDEFPGHIGCDSASRSELVIPLLVAGSCVGVFDLDSPRLARFEDSDRAGVQLWLDSLLRRLKPGFERRILASFGE
jgi:GAF domain-containing protein